MTLKSLWTADRRPSYNVRAVRTAAASALVLFLFMPSGNAYPDSHRALASAATQNPSNGDTPWENPCIFNIGPGA